MNVLVRIIFVILCVQFFVQSKLIAEENTNFNKLGFYRVAAISPKIEIGYPEKNAQIILNEATLAANQNAAVILFPELSLTGYTAEDLFHTEDLLQRVRISLQKIVVESENLGKVIIVGAPYRTLDGRLYNAAFVISGGKIIGAIPKTHLPNYKEFYEKRWFDTGRDVNEMVEDRILGKFNLSTNQLFRINDMVFAVEICEDLWAPISPGTKHALKGANVIFNLSGSNELVGKSTYRRNLVAHTSSHLNAAYVYASSGPTESTKDLVFGGHILIAENGALLAEGERFKLEGERVVADIDVGKLLHERMINKTFGAQAENQTYITYDLTEKVNTYLPDLNRVFSKAPFVPSDSIELDTRSFEIINIQAVSLARRLMSSGSESVVIGVSGGLDSTLALLAANEAIKILKWNSKQIIGVTMPGFGTTKRTKSSAHQLMTSLGITQMEIPIHKAVGQHFRDIGHDPRVLNVTYENSQARERTQILFDLANSKRGLVLGTGDLSELCLGWCTYNGDHMSSFNVNTSIPKTLVRYLVDWYSKNKAPPGLREVLERVLSTEVSPELLPPDEKGSIIQKTEDLVGPYRIIDFFIYHFLRNGFSPEKIYALASLSFKNEYSQSDIKKWLLDFYSRFAKNQFKRTTLPGGPKVGSVSVSPRGDLRLPDEISPESLQFSLLSQQMNCSSLFN